jgi:hypothetical protein
MILPPFPFWALQPVLYVNLTKGSLKDYLMHDLSIFDVPLHLLLDGLIANPLDERHRTAILILSVFPAHDEPGYQGVCAATHTATAGLKLGMAHQVQDLAFAKTKPRFSDELIVSPDGHNLLA